MWEPPLGVESTGQRHSRTLQAGGMYRGHWDVAVFQETAG